MLKSPTMFVIGAGASKEVDLPIGDQLRNIIAKSVDIELDFSGGQARGSREIYIALFEFLHSNGLDGRGMTTLLAAAHKIRDAMPLASSIDHFINAHNDDKYVSLCGKLAITSAILDAEKNSTMNITQEARKHRLDFERIEKTWYTRLMQLLSSSCDRSSLNLMFHNISFVVFNYDRTLEHYLYHALQAYYFIDAQRAAKLVASIPIYHPYGVVGHLPWEGQSPSTDFGETKTGAELLRSASQIRTFTEQVEDQSTLQNLRHSVAAAETIIFLGFGFHDQNMKLLCPEVETKTRRVFGTALGMSTSALEIIENTIRHNHHILPERHVAIRNDLDCNGLFYEYGRALMA